jgi:predicted amidohydrolase YtcJ
MTITIFSARKVITMNPSQPHATHVAVRDGRILGAGTLDELAGWGPHTVDARFADKVLMPGLVEGHAHLMAGALWRHTYCGYFDVADHEGRNWPGARTLDAVLARLVQSLATEAEGPLLGWGFDPIYFGSQRMNRQHLDQVSSERAVGVMHASGHILNVNTVALQRAGYLRTGIDHPGIPLGADGLPTGELKGPDAMMPAFAQVGLDRSFLSGDEFGIRAFGKLAVRAGVTTSTDLAATLSDAELDVLLRITSEQDYPLRLVPFLRLLSMSAADTVERACAITPRSTERLRLGRIKAVADGSIQGFSARMRWPGYFNGAPNGLWYTAPEALRECYTLALRRGVQVHTHTNGDEATELVLDCVAQALSAVPTRDHRFTMQHCQLADAAQYRRMAAQGMCANLFANHHFYWGDQHYATTVGPERAQRMNACATALRSGVPFSIHSDAPITPLGPLFTAWCAVNRLTASGRVLGAPERISVAEALHAVTLGAAYTLKLDGEIGSIECGKRADFCVLHEDPTAVDPMALKDVRVWGTVLGGIPFEAGQAA